jgi:hypothetical protein
MLKKYALKVGSTFNAINQMRPSKSSSSRSSTSDEDGSACSCDCNYNLNEVNRDLFIENYLIGRGGNKMRSSSLSVADDALKEAAQRKNNYRRTSLKEKRDDRLKFSRNSLFNDKTDRADRAVTRHRISVEIYDEDFGDERSLGYDFIESSAPTLRKIDNKLRDFVDVELSILFSRLHD